MQNTGTSHPLKIIDPTEISYKDNVEINLHILGFSNLKVTDISKEFLGTAETYLQPDTIIINVRNI